MKKLLAGVSLLTILAACTTSDFFEDASVVEISGKEYMVRQLQGRPNAWQAVANRPSLGEALVISPEEYGRNVRAIETVTGCSVDPATIQNRDNNTIAAVICN